MRLPQSALLLLALLYAACSTPSRQLPKYEAPLARTRFQTIKTTAYTHTESDHLAYGNKSALGTALKCGPTIHSAAADWGRWPAGTVFKLCSTNEIIFVDDYGWALTGRNTIDLYKPSRSAMNAWGARRETIEILRWGDPNRSLHRLRPAEKYAHVAQMIRDIKRFWRRPEPVAAPSPTLLALAQSLPPQP